MIIDGSVINGNTKKNAKRKAIVASLIHKQLFDSGSCAPLSHCSLMCVLFVAASSSLISFLFLKIYDSHN